MRICVECLLLAFVVCAPYAASAAETTRGVSTPYGEVSLPFELYKVEDAPIYYVIGLSGVPDSINEGHTSNAGFVVTDDGVVIFDALGTPALGYRLWQRIREVTDKPIERVIISHYHADHVYGLQAFKEHGGDPPVWSQELALGYVEGNSASQGEDAQRRLEQRRQALFPWVDEDTYIVTPDHTFTSTLDFEIGGISFTVRHLGPAHAPADAVMLVRDYGVLFSGDVIYKGRVPFLDSPDTDVEQWLEGLEYLVDLDPQPRFVIPGHGEPSENVRDAIVTTRDYIHFISDAMRDAAENLVSFEEAYESTDWSKYEKMPAFRSSNRGNAYRIYLEMQARLFD